MNRLEKANAYIEKHKGEVTARPGYHFSAEVGWLNDPNGFSFYQGEYHLFYQYNPYDIVWDSMHWGHATTKDFLTWDYHPVALANDRWYDANGCFSGSAIEKDGKLYLMYTGHVDPNLGFDRIESEIFERQCIAVSEDGVHFTKSPQNPVIGEKELPEGYRICDFRDPKVFERNGRYYCVVAVRNEARRGEIVMFVSSDLLSWTFHSSILQANHDDNIMLECPDFFTIDGKDVLLFSVMPCDPEFQDEIENYTAYAIGSLDFEKGVFEVESTGKLDFGKTFYAPQSTEGANGERLLIGWMHRWQAATPPKEYGFNGMMSLPRALSVENGVLVQKPAIDVSGSFPSQVDVTDLSILPEKPFAVSTTNKGKLTLTVLPESAKEFTVHVHQSEEKSSACRIDLKNEVITLSSDYGDEQPIAVGYNGNRDEPLVLEWFIDLHSIELFVNGGKMVISSTAYNQDKGNQISITANEEVILHHVTYGDYTK